MFPELDPDQGELPEGLAYREEFLALPEEAALIAWIDAQPWETDLTRRRQFHGGGYEDEAVRGPMPEVLAALANKVTSAGMVRETPDRCLINEYLPGQGISAHVDYDRFADEVVMISLLDSYPMRFQHIASGRVWEMWLQRGSVCVISGPSRYAWTHEIARRKSDPYPGGGTKLRGRRVSVTFRKTLELRSADRPTEDGKEQI